MGAGAGDSARIRGGGTRSLLEQHRSSKTPASTAHGATREHRASSAHGASKEHRSRYEPLPNPRMRKGMMAEAQQFDVQQQRRVCA
jgi:hypothetical protein